MGTSSLTFCLVCFTVAFVRGDEVLITTPHVAHTAQGQCLFPDVLKVELLPRDVNVEWAIHLSRDQVFPSVRSVLFMRDGGSSPVEEFQVDSNEHEGISAYHSHLHGAAFVVKCVRREEHRSYFQLEGSVYLGKQKYRITPSLSWPQRAQVFPSHVTTIYRMNPIVEFNAQDTAAMMPPSPEYVQSIARSYETLSRRKRAVTVPVTYTIDILTVIDYPLYIRFFNSSSRNATLTLSSIVDYLSSLFTAVSMRMDTLQLENRTLKIRMLTPMLLTSQTPGLSPYNITDLELDNGQYKIDATKLLNLFTKWLLATHKNLPNYDHAMLLTALNLYGGGDNGIKFNVTKGLANVGTICKTNGESASVIEDKGAYQSEGIVAHELAHGLGSGHDGEENECRSSDRFIMSDGSYPEIEGTTLNPWKFSSCSSKSIVIVLNTLEMNTTILERCLVNSSGFLDVEFSTISANKQCQLFYGNDSFVCRGTGLPSLDKLCDEFYCRIPGTSNCERMAAATGTCCGNQKKCYQGLCIDASQDQCPMSAVCPLGDQTDVILDNKTCAQLETTYCYSEDIYFKCCDTCERERIPDQLGCEFGNKQLGCDEQYCGTKIAQGQNAGVLYDFFCCGTCKQQCRDTANLMVKGANYTCRDYIINMGEGRVCYTPDVLEDCCQSCEDVRDAKNPLCAWGDQKDCSALLSRPVEYNCTSEQFQSCCYTCALLIARITTTTKTPLTTKPSTITTKPSTITTKPSTITTKPSTAAAITVTTKPTITATKAPTQTTPTPAPTKSSPTTKAGTPAKALATTRLSEQKPCDPILAGRCDACVKIASTSVLVCGLITVYICLIKLLSTDK